MVESHIDCPISQRFRQNGSASSSFCVSMISFIGCQRRSSAFGGTDARAGTSWATSDGIFGLVARSCMSSSAVLAFSISAETQSIRVIYGTSRRQIGWLLGRDWSSGGQLGITGWNFLGRRSGRLGSGARAGALGLGQRGRRRRWAWCLLLARPTRSRGVGGLASFSRRVCERVRRASDSWLDGGSVSAMRRLLTTGLVIAYLRNLRCGRSRWQSGMRQPKRPSTECPRKPR